MFKLFFSVFSFILIVLLYKYHEDSGMGSAFNLRRKLYEEIPTILGPLVEQWNA
jgi:hypothetical protein